MSPANARRGKNAKRPRAGGFTAQRAGSGVARYYQLYEQLSGAMQDGTIPAGGALPSEPGLVTRYKLSRTTVRRALARLEDEGRIVRQRGSGTFARQSREPPRVTVTLNDFFEDLQELEAKASATILRFESSTVPAVLRELHPQIGSRALVIQRLHRLQGTPYTLCTTYVPEPIGRRIRRSALEQASLLTVLDQTGQKTSKANYTTGAVAADAIAARRLDVSLGTPLLRTRVVLIDGHGRLAAVIESLSRPDRFHVHAVLERNSTRNPGSYWRLKRR